jgi:hypothetical protein
LPGRTGHPRPAPCSPAKPLRGPLLLPERIGAERLESLVCVEVSCVPSEKRRRNAVPVERRQLELPPAIAEEFVADLHAFFAAPDWLKKDEIAARQAARFANIGRHPAHRHQAHV